MADEFTHVRLKMDGLGFVEALELDGQDMLRHRVTKLELIAEGGAVTRMVLTFDCAAFEVDGELRVRHVCPLAEAG